MIPSPVNLPDRCALTLAEYISALMAKLSPPPETVYRPAGDGKVGAMVWQSRDRETMVRDERLMQAAKLAFETLTHQVAPSIDHDTAVRLANANMDRAGGWILQAWGRAHNCDPAELEFETAVCGGSNPGDLLRYRLKGKAGWGKLLAIRPCSLPPEACKPGREAARLWFCVKENNPIRHRQVTRNELKLAMGRAGLVNLAGSKSFTWFNGCVKPQDEADIRDRTGLTVKEFWRAVRKGDSAVVARLGAVPRKRRERMREAGMFVAPYVPPPQLEMFP